MDRCTGIVVFYDLTIMRTKQQKQYTFVVSYATVSTQTVVVNVPKYILVLPSWIKILIKLPESINIKDTAIQSAQGRGPIN